MVSITIEYEVQSLSLDISELMDQTLREYISDLHGAPEIYAVEED